MTDDMAGAIDRLTERALATAIADEVRETRFRSRLLKRIVGSNLDAAREVLFHGPDRGAGAAASEFGEMTAEDRQRLRAEVLAELRGLIRNHAVDLGVAAGMYCPEDAVAVLDWFPAEAAALGAVVAYLRGGGGA